MYKMTKYFMKPLNEISNHARYIGWKLIEENLYINYLFLTCATSYFKVICIAQYFMPLR